MKLRGSRSRRILSNQLIFTAIVNIPSVSRPLCIIKQVSILTPSLPFLMTLQFLQWTKNTITFLSENSSVIVHVLITIHNLYLLISSHNQKADEDVEQLPIDVVQQSIPTTIVEESAVASEEEEERSTVNESMYISIASYDDGYSSGCHSSAVSPTIILPLNGSLPVDAFMGDVEQQDGEKTVKRDDSNYCANENGRHAITCPCPDDSNRHSFSSLSHFSSSCVDCDQTVNGEEDFR